jgi:hypothetical protein
MSDIIAGLIVFGAVVLLALLTGKFIRYGSGEDDE